MERAAGFFIERLEFYMTPARSMGITIALQPLIDDLSKRFRYAITYPGHKAFIKFKLRAAVLHHESTDVLCVSVILANWRISCELITVPIKTHGRGLHAEWPNL